jgi:hypothetical protein
MIARGLAGLLLAWAVVVGDRGHDRAAQAGTRWILAYPGTPKGGIGTSYTVDDFVRLLGVVDSSGRVKSWLCTGVIFLQLYAPSGRTFTTWGGGTAATGTDWAEYLDSLAGPRGALNRLDSAVSVVEAAAGDLGTKLPVSLMVPYPEPTVDSVNFWGATYSTTTPEGRAASVASYVRAATVLFARAGFRHLRLDGFYWLAENVAPRDTATVIRFAAEVHRAHLRLLWIPYYFALGQDQWRHLGFDEAWLQPNYFFHVDVAPGRLDSAASRAQQEHLGVEVEFNSEMFSDSQYARRLDPYLDMLMAYPALRQRSIAIYDGQGALVRLSQATTPEDRALYARFVRVLTARDER